MPQTLTTKTSKKGIPLKAAFRQERKRQRALQKAYELSSYLSPLTLELACKLHYQDGVFTLPGGAKPHGRYLFVRTLSGEIFIASEGEVGHHSYLSDGKRVLSSGYFFFEQGKMYLVSNESGHYTPTNEEMKEELRFYYDIAKNKHLIYEDHSKVPSKNLISHYPVREIIEKTKVEEASLIFSFKKESNYGKKLDTTAEPSNSHYTPQPNLCENDTAMEQTLADDPMVIEKENFLPDYWLQVTPVPQSKTEYPPQPFYNHFFNKNKNKEKTNTSSPSSFTEPLEEEIVSISL